jgi:hypothetical protein
MAYPSIMSFIMHRADLFGNRKIEKKMPASPSEPAEPWSWLALPPKMYSM